jgi:hypothetical protein
VIEAEPGEIGRKRAPRKTGVQQRSDEHVPSDTGKGVDVEHCTAVGARRARPRAG